LSRPLVGDVVISIVSNARSDWSFGFGEAQYATGKLRGTTMAYVTIDPSNEQLLKQFSEHTDEQLEGIITRSDEVYRTDWRLRSLAERRALGTVVSRRRGFPRVGKLSEHAAG
jgi:hypothetical protein